MKTSEPARFEVRDRHILMAFAGVLVIAICLERLTIGGAGLWELFALERGGGGSD